MSGLRKAKKYDWKDSNLALFGSDTEKQVKKASAETEPAWAGAGTKVGLQIWRIVQFKVVEWPKEDYGEFFNGDSYIVLNTYKADPDSEALSYDVHFWIGQYSTQDEYGTAAYKTVELDTFLDDAAVQHREVQGHESPLFLSYFKTIQILSGGADSGFRRVQPTEYKPRLLHFSGARKTITIKEVPLARSRLNSSDVFVLDNGLTITQWNGESCNKDEKFKAVQFVQNLKSERNAKSECLDERDISPSHSFYSFLDQDDEDDEDIPDEPGFKALFKVSDASGSLNLEQVDNVTSSDDLDPNDVFVLDSGIACYVWIGSGASIDEKRNAMGYAHKMLQDTTHPLIPVTVVNQGRKTADFDTAIAA